MLYNEDRQSIALSIECMKCEREGSDYIWVGDIIVCAFGMGMEIQKRR